MSEAKKKLQERLKQRKKAFKSSKRKETSAKNIDYDLISDDEKNKYFAPDGRCLFFEMTGESRYPQFVIDRAFDDYLEGLPLESIATKMGISSSTIGKWSSSQSWQQKVDKFKASLADKYEKDKLKEAAKKRKKIEDKHEQQVSWLQMEIQWEMNKPYPIGSENDPKAQFMFETRRNLRMKTWAITVNAMKTLIDVERAITGVDKEQENESRLPSSFTFELALPNGQTLNGIEDLRSVLPSQDPYAYIASQQPKALTDGSDTPQLARQDTNATHNDQTAITIPVVPVSQNMPLVGGENKKPLDPIVIPNKVGEFEGTAAQEQAIKPHPVFGYLNMGINTGGNRQY